MPQPIQIFIAYSREDADYLTELRKHLKPLERNNAIKMWYDGEIVPGSVWEQEIKKVLHQADIILLLVSANALNSDYFYEKEMEDALARDQKQEAMVVPIILNSCAWDITPLAHLQALPKDALPISKWASHSDAYTDIVRGINKCVQIIQQRRQEQTEQADREQAERNRLQREAQEAQREREQAEQLQKENRERRNREQREQEHKAEQQRLQRERERAQSKKQFWQQLQAADDLFAQNNYAQAQKAYQNLINWDNKTDLGYTDAQPHIAKRLLECQTETRHADLKKQAQTLYQQGKYTAALQITQEALKHRTDPEMGNLQNELNRLIEEANKQRTALIKKIGAGVGGLLLLCLFVWGIKGIMGGKNEVPTTPINNTDSTQTQTATTTPATPQEQPEEPTPNTNNKTDDLYTKSVTAGNALFVQGKYTEAKKQYEAALKEKPKDKAATDNLKKCEEQLKPKTTITPSGSSSTKPTPITTPSSSTATDGSGKPTIKMIAIPGKNYSLSETEVTIGQYLAFCKATNSHWPEWLEKGNENNIHTGTNDWYKKIGMSESNSNYPITGVSATDADAFCRWMGGRLPTEQEWEYAAKGGQSYEYAGSNTIGEVAWYDENSGSKAHPVKQKRANGYGLYDMSGNVWEWTSSTEGSRRVLRGGSWNYFAADCRVANRAYDLPDYRNNYLGFRLAVR